MALNPALAPEIGPDGLSREAPVIAYTEKIIEEEQLQLRKYIEENYSKIRDVERELAGLTMEMKLTAGPKKAALELLRNKIEASTEKIRVAKLKEEEARKVWEAASKVVKDEEAVKQKLCEDLTKLVQESSNSQYARLEELKRRLEALNPIRSSATTPLSDVKADVCAQNSLPSDAAAVPNSDEATSVQGNGKPMSATNVNPAVGEEAKGKKKVHFQVKGKGIGAGPKSKSSSGPGWTGAGFDVEGRT